MAATQASYDAVAAAYAEVMSDELRRKPLDRALLTAFAPRPPRTPRPTPESVSRPPHQTATM